MFKTLVRQCLKFLFRVQIQGDPGAFQNKRTLIVANHESFIDGLLVWLAMPVHAVFVVHSQVLKRFWCRLFLRWVPHLAVDAINPLAMKQVVKLVETGQPVVIFPEGRVTCTGSLMKIYDGAAFVAAKSQATLVPVRIEGAARSFFGRLADLFPRRWRPEISVTIGSRCVLPMPNLSTARERRHRLGDRMRRILLDMRVETRPAQTLFEAFLAGMRHFGASSLLIEDIRMKGETYRSTLKMVLALRRLTSKFSAVDETVGIIMPNAAVTSALILGLSCGRRIPALLNFTTGIQPLKASCTTAGIRTIVTSRTFLERAHLEELPMQLAGVQWVFMEELTAQARWSDKAWVLWHWLLPAGAAVPQKPDAPAAILFTSGTEGVPKGVVHSHASLLANVAQVCAVADFTPRDKLMVSLPMFHSFGLTCGVLLPLVAGCKVFLYPNPLHYRAIPELTYDRDCTVLFGTSTFLGNYGRAAHPYDFARLRYVVAGAEKLSADVQRLWADKFGIRILEGYGVTECAPVIAVNCPMAYQAGTVGQLLPGIECRIEPVPGIDHGGALHVRGPNVMSGYLRHDRPGVIEPPHSLGDGWYATGDIAEIDDAGYLQLCGRLKRFAKIAGEMVSLDAVEQIAFRAAPQHAHAVCTCENAAKGEALVLFTTAQNLERSSLLAAARLCGASELAIPRLVRHVEALPLLGTGKIDYVKLKEWTLVPVRHQPLRNPTVASPLAMPA